MKAVWIALTVALAAVPAHAKASSFSPYSAKIVCADKTGNGQRNDGPWRLPSTRPALSWGIGFPYVMHGHPGGETCSLFLGPASSVRAFKDGATPRSAGRAPYNVAVECWSSGTSSPMKWIAVPTRGITASSFSVASGDFCVVFGGRAGMKMVETIPVPYGGAYDYGTSGQPTWAAPSHFYVCGNTSSCSFRVRASRDTRWRFDYGADYTGVLTMIVSSGSWSVTSACEISAGIGIRCSGIGSGSAPSSGTIAVQVSSYGNGHWAAGADSRPRWPS